MRRIKHWIVDYTHMIRGRSKMYLRHNPPKHYLEHIKEGKVPVVLVPGWSLRWAFYKHLGDHISLEGHPVYIVPKLKNNLFDIPKSAEIVREVIDKNKLDNVIIVSHSKGGLIGKYLLIHHNDDKKVVGLIAIATPFSGTAMAKLLPLKSTKEFLPDSKIVLNLKRHTVVNHKIISISPRYDNHVWAEEGSVLDGALKNIKLNVRGHHKVIFSKEMEETIIRSIAMLTDKTKVKL